MSDRTDKEENLIEIAIDRLECLKDPKNRNAIDSLKDALEFLRTRGDCEESP